MGIAISTEVCKLQRFLEVPHPCIHEAFQPQTKISVCIRLICISSNVIHLCTWLMNNIKNNTLNARTLWYLL